MRTILTLVITAIAIVLPTTAAQSLTEPLEDHADQKAAAAIDDPVGFAQAHASEEALAQEAEWGVAYGCYAVDYAEHEHGTPDPELEQCEDYEEALGIEEEPREELAQAIAENLTEEPIAEAQALADDALATARRIGGEPTSALDELIGFLHRALAAAGRLIGGALILLQSALSTALQAASGLAHASLGAASLVLESLGVATTSATSFASTGLDLIDVSMAALASGVSAIGALAGGLGAGAAQLAGSLGGGLTQALAAVGDGVGAAGDAVADAFDAVGTALGEMVDALLGKEEPKLGGPTDGRTPDLPVGTDSLLPDVERIVDGLA